MIQRDMFKPDLFNPPVLARPAQLSVGMVFSFGGRFLRVHRVYGSDPAAPVIVEELADGPTSLKGQFALWGADGVVLAISKGGRP